MVSFAELDLFPTNIGLSAISMKNQLVVEAAVSEDKAEVLALLQESFAAVQRSSSVQRGMDFWDWKYRTGPFGVAIVQIIRIEGRIAASGVLWPMSLTWNHRILRALQLCDTAVHSEFRRRGLFGLLNEARKDLAAQQQYDLIFNFPNANSLPGYVKSGWQYAGRVPWLVRVAKPMAVVRDRLNPGKSKAIEVPTEYNLCESIASDIPAHLAGAQHCISLDRPAGYWRWRFSEHPNRQYGLVHSSTDPNSIAVFTLSRKPSGLIEMVIVDLVCEPESLSGLLGAILKCARRVGAGFIALMKPRGLPIGAFYRRAFAPVREKNLAVLPLAADLPDKIADIEHWNFRAAMHDSI